MDKKKTIMNIIMSLLLQLITTANGLVVPKIILTNFGSDVNGLVSSINQFLNYITLLEGGVGAVVMAALYRPLVNCDEAGVSSVVKAAERFFKSIAKIYVAYVIIVACVLPFLFRGQFSWLFISSLVVVIALNLFIQYYFSITYRTLLNADQRGYIVSLTQIIFVSLNLIISVVVAKLCPEIHFLKLASTLAFIIQPIIYSIYMKKHYRIDKYVEADGATLKQRWDGFGQNLAYVVHMNTDVTVLTFLSSLSSVSIYSVYYLVVSALRNVVVSISTAIIPSLGKVLVGDKQELKNSSFDIYELCIGLIATILFTCGAILVTPFVAIYTANIKDANYHQSLFGVLIMLASCVGCIREPYINVANAYGHFKKIAKYAYMEALINILLSVVLVYKFELVGVAIGTLIACTFRYIAQVVYIKKNILYRPILKSFKSFLCYMIIFIVSYYLTNALLRIEVSGYSSWFFEACITFILVIIVTAIVVMVFYSKFIMNIIKTKLNRR